MVKNTKISRLFVFIEKSCGLEDQKHPHNQQIKWSKLVKYFQNCQLVHCNIGVTSIWAHNYRFSNLWFWWQSNVLWRRWNMLKWYQRAITSVREKKTHSVAMSQGIFILILIDCKQMEIWPKQCKYPRGKCNKWQLFLILDKLKSTHIRNQDTFENLHEFNEIRSTNIIETRAIKRSGHKFEKAVQIFSTQFQLPILLFQTSHSTRWISIFSCLLLPFSCTSCKWAQPVCGHFRERHQDQNHPNQPKYRKREKTECETWFTQLSTKCVHTTNHSNCIAVAKTQAAIFNETCPTKHKMYKFDDVRY